MIDPVYNNLRVLVADDQPFVRNVLVRFLDKLGCHEVLALEDGQQVLDRIGDFIPDIAFLDIHMKPLSGIQAVARLRLRGDSIANTPVVFLTAEADSQFVQSARKLKASGYLLKPLKPVKLDKTIRTVLAHRWEEA